MALQQMHVFVDLSWLIMTILFILILHVPRHMFLLFIFAILWHEDFGFSFILMAWWLLKPVASLRIKHINITKTVYVVGNMSLVIMKNVLRIVCEMLSYADVENNLLFYNCMRNRLTLQSCIEKKTKNLHSIKQKKLIILKHDDVWTWYSDACDI